MGFQRKTAISKKRSIDEKQNVIENNVSNARKSK